MNNKKIPALYAALSLFSIMLILCSLTYPWYEWNYNEEARGKLVYSDGNEVKYWYEKSEGAVEYKLFDYEAIVITDGNENTIKENYESTDSLSGFMFTLVLFNFLGLIMSLIIFVISVMIFTETSIFLAIKNINLIIKVIMILAVVTSLLSPIIFYTSFTENAVNPIFSTATHGDSIYELAGASESLTGNGTRISEPAENCFSNDLLGCKITSDWKTMNGWLVSIVNVIPLLIIMILSKILPLKLNDEILTEEKPDSAPPRPPGL